MLSRRALPLVACGGGDPTPGWQTLSSGEAGALLAVWGTSARDVWVVGGRSELMGAPTAPVTWRGVAAGASRVFVVGESGVVGQRTSDGWTLIEPFVTQLTFHAAWIDPTGGLWGVGDMFDTLPLTSDGFLAYYDVEAPPEVPL
jgi:hypothetical protein